MMNDGRNEIDAIETAERLRNAGAWALALGSIVGVLAVVIWGILPQLSPKSATSIYAGLAGSGLTEGLFVPMIGISTGLVVIGLLFAHSGQSQTSDERWSKRYSRKTLMGRFDPARIGYGLPGTGCDGRPG
jgi:hypothetical protein